MQTIFLKFLLPIIIIIAVCITTYFVMTKPDTMKESMVASVEQRVTDVKLYENEMYKVILSEVANEKTKFYIMSIGAFLVLCWFGFQLLRLILSVDNNFLLFPDKYKIVAVEEADSIRYLKDKFIEANIISNNELLEKKHVIKLISQNDNYHS